MKSSLTSPKVTEVLDALYAEASQSDALMRQTVRSADVPSKTEADFYKAARKSYMAVGRDFGNLLYCLVAREAKPTKSPYAIELLTSKNVEFGTVQKIICVFRRLI